MRHYTREEANELLPHLAPVLTELQTKYQRAQEAQEALDRAAASNGGSAKRKQWTRLIARVQEILARLDNWEIVLRDVDQGLVDFPAIVDGQEAFLCWKLGEPRVSFWHLPDTGFAGRQPL
jgi:hypothetical protein